MAPTAPPPILIAGATASGKSALALAIAERVGGVVVNADSMQVYRDLPLLTAQPTAAERTRCPHRLYGHVSAAVAYSTGQYLTDMAQVLKDAAATGLRPVITGGTGLYFKALLEGLSPIPPVPAAVREHWRRRAATIPATELHRDLAARDAVMAARLHPQDRQRVTRALEVVDSTGVSLAHWQARAGTPLVDAAEAIRIVVDRPRDDLHRRCDVRFDAMMAAGALDEVAALAARRLSPDLPAMRAIGVRPLLDHLAGRCPLDAAVAAAKLETRQYVKRQQTWLRRNMSAWKSVVAQQMENMNQLIASIV